MIYPTYGQDGWEQLSIGGKLDALRRQGERIEHECYNFKDGLRDLARELAPILHHAGAITVDQVADYDQVDPADAQA